MNLKCKATVGILAIVFGVFASVFNANAEHTWLHNFVEEEGDTVTKRDRNQIFRENIAIWERDEQGRYASDLALELDKPQKYEVIMYSVIYHMRENIIRAYESNSEPEQEYLDDYLVRSCQNRCASDIILALGWGANPEVRTAEGFTPLHGIALGNNFGTRLMYNQYPCRFLLKRAIDVLIGEYGADVNARDNEGRTPLHMVTDKVVAESLVENGANINALDDYGCTPLGTLRYNYERYATMNNPVLFRLREKMLPAIEYLRAVGAHE